MADARSSLPIIWGQRILPQKAAGWQNALRWPSITQIWLWKLVTSFIRPYSTCYVALHVRRYYWVLQLLEFFLNKCDGLSAPRPHQYWLQKAHNTSNSAGTTMQILPRHLDATTILCHYDATSLMSTCCKVLSKQRNGHWQKKLKKSGFIKSFVLFCFVFAMKRLLCSLMADDCSLAGACPGPQCRPGQLRLRCQAWILQVQTCTTVSSYCIPFQYSN